MSTTVLQRAPGVAGAWIVSQGAGATVAVVDEDANAQRHPEFNGRISAAGAVLVAEATDTRVSRPHGTKVAGLAVAGGLHVTGLAPAALLLPVAVPALSMATGTRDEAQGLRWAADHGADVICCAWAPRRPT